MSGTITCNGAAIHPGETFQPFKDDADYVVTYIGIATLEDKLILRDEKGEFHVAILPECPTFDEI